METVQVQCGSCGKVMAINVAHLGAQVHCPHCRAIVQAPPAKKSTAPEVPPKATEEAATESIFAEAEPGDLLFGEESEKSLVEMPAEPVRSNRDLEIPTQAYLSPSHAGLSSNNDPTEFDDAPGSSWKDRSESALGGSQADVAEPGIAEAPTEMMPAAVAITGPPKDEPKGDLADAVMNVRRAPRPSNLPIILLIFLVPYSLVCTGVVVWLLMNQRYYDPLERLPDPKPKDGGPRLQVAHNSPLPAKLKTKLTQAIQIGDVEVTPLSVVATEEGDLTLVLKVKNVSRNLAFNPVPDSFLKYVDKGPDSGKPYTYLDWSERKMFGGYGDWIPRSVPPSPKFTGEIGPGEEEIIRITTSERYQKDIRRLRDSKDDVVWRVQVRRGLVDVRGKKVSATAVIGVEFNARAIEDEGV